MYKQLSTPNIRPLGSYLNELVRVLTCFKPTHMTIALDPVDSLTKISDISKLDQLKSEYQNLLPLSRSLGLCTLEVNKYKADDIIATLSRLAEEEGFEKVRIMSNDKGFYQCLSSNISVMKLTGKKFSAYHLKKFVEAYNILPQQFPDYLVLVGDSKFPGIPGIGKKIGHKLLKDFGSLESVLDAAKNRSRSVTILSAPKNQPDDEMTRGEMAKNTYRNWKTKRSAAISMVKYFSKSGAFDNAFVANALSTNNSRLKKDYQSFLLSHTVDLPITLKDSRFQGFALDKAFPVLRDLNLESLIPQLQKVNHIYKYSINGPNS